MVEVELYFDGSTSVGYYDAEGTVVPTSATLTLSKPDGTTISTPTVTLPTLSTTTQNGTTASALVLGAVTGLSRGSHIRIVSDGVTYVSEVSRVDGTTVYLTAALPVTPDTSSPVKHLDCTASVSAPGSSNVGSGLRLTWVLSDGTTTRRHGQAAAVVRWPWTSPATPEDVREILAVTYSTNRSESFCVRLADRVNDRIRSAVIGTGRRPWMYLSSDLFRATAEAGIRWALAEEGICLGGQPYEAQRELRFSFQDSLTQVLESGQRDQDLDGQLSSDERRPMHFSIRTVR